MKILMINSVCGVGSTGRICTDLCDTLEKNGHEVKIAYGRGEAPLNYKENSYKIGSDFLVKLNGLKARLFDNEGFNAKSATKKFLKWVESYN
ncbi:MAG: glycosyl transferase, partial [Clostridia bacterium]|nr:glycosyl transferase [Clostridia bacterium]